MFRFLILLIGIMVAVNAWHYETSHNVEWHSFKRKYNYKFETKINESKRMKIFYKNLKEITRHNEGYRIGKCLYEQDVNEYAAMREHEAVAILTGFRERMGNHSHYHESRLGGAKIPKSIDWRKKGAVVRVKFQGMCPACWAFGALGSFEGAYFRKHNKLIEFSEQNLMDCIRPYRKMCYTGGFKMTFNYIKTYGIETEKSYPYIGMKDRCHHKRKNSLLELSHFVQIPIGNETALTDAIANHGPITVTFSLKINLVFYKSGIYYEEICPEVPHQLHCVLAVGYGTDENGNDYYILRNSWSVDWGDRGYFKMARNRGNMCGIADRAFYPVLRD